MINENNKIALLYSRRQDKPRYEDLNPFEISVSISTIYDSIPK